MIDDEHGAVLVEYALILSLLAVLFVAGMRSIEVAAGTALDNITTKLLIYQQGGT